MVPIAWLSILYVAYVHMHWTVVDETYVVGSRVVGTVILNYFTGKPELSFTGKNALVCILDREPRVSTAVEIRNSCLVKLPTIWNYLREVFRSS